MANQFRITIHGRVQGVGFRYAARTQARSLNLKGWVSNRSDGSVEAVVQGTAEACSQFMTWCREGTGYSWVERVDIHEMEPESLGPFFIRL